jgi:hypothetical protein
MRAETETAAGADHVSSRARRVSGKAGRWLSGYLDRLGVSPLLGAPDSKLSGIYGTPTMGPSHELALCEGVLVFRSLLSFCLQCNRKQR